MNIERAKSCGNSSKSDLVYKLIQDQTLNELAFLSNFKQVIVETIVTHGKFAVAILSCDVKTRYSVFFTFRSAGSKEVESIECFMK